MTESTMAREQDTSIMGMLADHLDAQTRLEKSIEDLAVRLAAVLGPAVEQQPVSGVTAVPSQRSDLAQRILDMYDTTRRLIIKVDRLGQRIEL